MSASIDFFIEQIAKIISRGDSENFQKNAQMMSSLFLNPLFGNSSNMGNELFIWKETERLINLHFPDLLDSLKSTYLKFNQESDIYQKNKLSNILYMMVRYKVDQIEMLSPKIFESLAYTKKNLAKSPSCNFNGAQNSGQFFLKKSKSNLDQLNLVSVNRKEAYLQNTRNSLKINEKFVEEVLMDVELINELVFVMSGCESGMLKFKPLSKMYQVDQRVRLSRSQRTILAEIAQTGYLLNEINAFVDKYCGGDGGSGGASDHFGTVQQAFVACIVDFKVKHFDYVHKVRVQVEKDQRSGAIPLWNTRRLYYCTKRNLANFCAIYRIIQMIENSRGGALLSVLFLMSYHGSENCKLFCRNIFKRTFSAFHDILLLWLNEGKLIDVHNEFFIESNANCSDESYWDHKFKIKHQMVPLFMPNEFVEKVLEIGKHMNFVQEMCNENISLSEFSEEINAYCQRNKFLGNVFFSCDRFLELNDMVNKASHIASSLVYKVMIEKFSLRDHFHALRSYMLLGQGDFTQRLIELLASDLTKPISKLQTALNKMFLLNAIQTSNARRDKPEILELLDLKLFPGTENEIGWDLFTLHYNIKGPLMAIFGTHLETYESLFRFLWRLKRVEYTLSTIWSRQLAATRSLAKNTAYAYLMQQINLLTSALNHFMGHVKYFFLFEIVDFHWKQFQTEFDDAKCLDDILSAHDSTLRRIKDGLFFGSECNAMSSQFLTILNFVMDLQKIQNSVFELIDYENNGYASLVAVATSAARSTTTIANSKKTVPQKNDFDLEKKRKSVSSNLRNLSDRHLINMRTLCAMLAKSTQIELQELGFHIDFNEYYLKTNSSDTLNSSTCLDISSRFADDTIATTTTITITTN